jgi:hypothetical protein
MLLSIFEELINDNKILLKHENLLKTLSDDRVMIVCHSDESGYYIEECCDEWYSHDLTKEECLELSELFKEIAENIKD